jgi:hypothetical protein
MSIHSSQHHVFRHSQSVFFRYGTRPSFALIRNNKNIYVLNIFNIYIFKKETEVLKILNFLVADIYPYLIMCIFQNYSSLLTSTD